MADPNNTSEISRLWPKRVALRAEYYATDDDGETDALFVYLDRIEGEILRCQAVSIEDLQRQAEIVDHQNLGPDEAGLYLAHQVFNLLQSIRGLRESGTNTATASVAVTVHLQH